MIYLYIILACLWILIILILIHYTKVIKNRDNQKKINLRSIQVLKESNFEITKMLYINDYATFTQDKIYKKLIIVDERNKRIGFINYDNGSLIMTDFNEILNFEIYENGCLSTFGMGVGCGIFLAETSGMCREMRLIIRLKRYDISQITYEIINKTLLNYAVNKSSSKYKQCISTMQEALSFLEVIKNENLTKNEIKNVKNEKNVKK